MSHEIYGFKHPHAQWEGILALDIWYNLLYREIDAKYPFDDKFMDMNPMSRLKIQSDGDGEYVQYSDDVKMYKANMPDGFEWMEDETSSEFAYIWDSNLWTEYYENSQRITDTRRECTTPRGVLEKIFNIVHGLEYKWESYLEYAQRDTDGDYKWFKQPGKVYAHWDMWDESNKYSKYVNLHLGRAYEVMSGKEYYELTGEGRTVEEDGTTTYTKRNFSDIPINSETGEGLNRRQVLDLMMERGFMALIDAFSVVKNEHLFNVFNNGEYEPETVICDATSDVVCETGSESEIVCGYNEPCVEEFSKTNAMCYSQAQCAIAIERVFSRIYKYLQFKSTTSETFQRHINIDSGYKYLTTDSLKNSDHELKYYYDPTDP